MYLLLGSSSLDLLKQSGETLAGRISYFEMGGPNLHEVGSAMSDLALVYLRKCFADYGVRWRISKAEWSMLRNWRVT